MPPRLYPHPLALPNIVSNILQHFTDTNFLVSLRLVSHCWNQEACSVLRRQNLVIFKSLTFIADYNRIYENTFEIFGTFPHSQYQFDLPRYDRKDLGPDDSLPAPVAVFFERFGEFITKIHVLLRRGNVELPELDLILSQLPNLTTLGLTIQYFHDPNPCLTEFSSEAAINLGSVHTLIVQVEGIEMSEDFTTSLLSLMFSYMPNLRRISFPGDIRRISKVGLLLRDIILDSETSSNLTRLCEWDFKIRLLEEEALKLLCKEFPIKMLHVDLWNPEDDMDSISSDLMAGLLRKWSESLEQLAVEFPWRKEISFHFHFPLVMRKLTFLVLNGLEESVLELLKKLPSLKRLELSQLDLKCVVPKPEEDDKFLTVRQLRVDFCDGQNSGIICRFSRMFPELRSLNINHTTNEVARVIFQKMPKLIRLHMQGNDLTDAGICGFSEATLKEKDFMELSPAQGNKHRKYPFVADLKELQFLKLDAYALTEVSVRHGLVHCTSLRLVKMDCTGSNSSCYQSTTICRTFKLAEYGNQLVEEGNSNRSVVEMKEEPPLDNETLAFFQSHHDLSTSADLVNLKP